MTEFVARGIVRTARGSGGLWGAGRGGWCGARKGDSMGLHTEPALAHISHIAHVIRPLALLVLPPLKPVSGIDLHLISHRMAIFYMRRR
jgi:hypothetical protein